MSDIGRFSGGSHWSTGSDMPRRDASKRQDRTVGFGKSGVSAGDHGEAAVTTETLTAFELSIRMATKSFGEKHEEASDDPFTDARLLAQAEAAAGTSSLPSFVDLTPAPATQLAPSGSHLVATVTQHIEDAIRADMRPNKDTPLTLHLNFAQANTGLTGLTMAVTPTTLDVVLERATGDLTPELMAATAALADRLRLRFGKRIVRILDRVTSAAPAATPSLSDLFSTSGS